MLITVSNAQTRRAVALSAQPLHGGNDTSRNCCDRPVSIHFRKTPQTPVVLDNRRGQGSISAHALLEDLFRVIGSLGQRRTLYIAEPILLRRIHEIGRASCRERG